MKSLNRYADASVLETISTLGLNLCRWSIVDIETAGNDYCRTSEGRQGVGSLEGQSREDEHCAIRTVSLVRAGPRSAPMLAGSMFFNEIRL